MDSAESVIIFAASGLLTRNLHLLFPKELLLQNGLKAQGKYFRTQPLTCSKDQKLSVPGLTAHSRVTQSVRLHAPKIYHVNLRPPPPFRFYICRTCHISADGVRIRNGLGIQRGGGARGSDWKSRYFRPLIISSKTR
jgi:hypothetical protein